jgi:hypothetical protein
MYRSFVRASNGTRVVFRRTLFPATKKGHDVKKAGRPKPWLVGRPAGESAAMILSRASYPGNATVVDPSQGPASGFKTSKTRLRARVSHV